MDGNVESLAKQVEKGANSIEGVEAKLWQARLLFNCKSFYTVINNGLI